MLRLLRTRRWVGFTALVVLAILAFGLLSRWQWGRAEDKRLAQSVVDQHSDLVATELTAVAPSEWTHVTVTGEYLPDTQVVVRQRPLESRNGYWVLTALRDPRDRVVWVNRGWLAASGPATATPDSPAPPTGQVAVTGWWRPMEQAKDDTQIGLPEGMVSAIDARVLPVASSLSGYVQAGASDDPALIPVPRPQADDGRNISYAVQWLLFAVVALVGWWFFLRREAADDAKKESAHDDAVA